MPLGLSHQATLDSLDLKQKLISIKQPEIKETINKQMVFWEPSIKISNHYDEWVERVERLIRLRIAGNEEGC